MKGAARSAPVPGNHDAGKSLAPLVVAGALGAPQAEDVREDDLLLLERPRRVRLLGERDASAPRRPLAVGEPVHLRRVVADGLVQAIDPDGLRELGLCGEPGQDKRETSVNFVKPRISRSVSTRCGSFLDERSSLGAK